MPLFDPNAAPEKTPMPEEAPQEEAYVAEVIDSQFVPATNLITHVAGSNWSVKYFKQFLSEESTGSALSLSQEPVHQQYTEINDLIIKVESALTSSQNSETGEFEVTGEAHITPPLLPTVGDMFIADIGDGTAGVFSIETIERLSIFKEACFKVTYSLKDRLTSEIEQDFKTKTLKSYYWNVDYLMDGLNPLLVEEEHVQVESLKEHIHELIQAHYVEFFSREDQTLLVPDDSKTIYDPALIKMYNRSVSNEELGNFKRPQEIDCTGSVNTLVSTVWDTLLKLDDTLLYLCSKRSRLVSSKEFATMPVFGSVALSGVTDVVWGKYELTHKEKLAGKSVDPSEDNAPETPEALYGTPDTILAYPVDIDDYYVFSKHFYEDNEGNMSAIELETRKCMGHKPLSVATLLDLVGESRDWVPIQRFYYIPVLLILMRIALRGG